MSGDVQMAQDSSGACTPPNASLFAPKTIITIASAFALFLVIYWESFNNLIFNWRVVDSYYSHGFLIPPISLFFVWREREALRNLPLAPSLWGLAWISFASLLLLLGDFLGFAIFPQISMIPMLTGLSMVFLSKRHTARIWFPLLFLFFMIPIPYSLMTGVSFQLKLLATKSSVLLAQAMTFPMVQTGSYVHFGGDRLLIGDVCGGLRSLIALLAFGALMGYISKTQPWARLVILSLCGPVAVVSNISRILFLCIYAYFRGSGAIAGLVHDLSGLAIFAIAFMLLFSLEGFLRKVAPSAPAREDAQ